MSLVRTKPFGLFRDIDRLFFDLDERDYLVPVDILENDEEYIVKANLPGIDKDNISIEINPAERFVIIQAEMEKENEEEKEENNVRYIHRERVASKFSRRINFNQIIDVKAAKTSYENGVLILTLPKSEEAKSVKLTVN